MIGYGSAIEVVVPLLSLFLKGLYIGLLGTSLSEGSSKHERFAFAASVATMGSLTLCLLSRSCSRLWKNTAKINAIPPVILPSFHWDSYRAAIARYGPLHYIGNSTMVAVRQR